jgi:hypothetical protein
MTTAPAHGLTEGHSHHHTTRLFLIVLAALAVAATAIVLFATTPWSSDSSTPANPPVPKAVGHVVQCEAYPVIHPC